jgi:N-acetylmuramoyl-L-alanine amidase
VGCTPGTDAAPPAPADSSVSTGATPAPTTAAPPALPPSTEPTATARLGGKVIVVDPGHNGGNATHGADIAEQVFIGNGTKECDTTGTQTGDGYEEFAFNMDVADRLTRQLETEGAQVVLTRADNRGWGPCITERAAIGNEAEADLALSIHADGGPASGRGFHVLVPTAVPGYNDGIVAPSTVFGTVLRDTYAARTGLPVSTYLGREGLMPRSDLGGLNLSRVPKVFLETGNMRNAIDARQLQDPAFRDTIASAIVEAMMTYFERSG